MSREKASLMAREMIKLSREQRADALKALDTEFRILVIEELFLLKGDAPPGKIPNCS